jgi:hypothetical protein
MVLVLLCCKQHGLLFANDTKLRNVNGDRKLKFFLSGFVKLYDLFLFLNFPFRFVSRRFTTLHIDFRFVFEFFSFRFVSEKITFKFSVSGKITFHYFVLPDFFITLILFYFSIIYNFSWNF